MPTSLLIGWLKRPLAQYVFLSLVAVTFSVSLYPIISAALDNKLAVIVLVVSFGGSIVAAFWIGPKVLTNIYSSYTQANTRQEKVVTLVWPVVIPFWIVVGSAIALYLLTFSLLPFEEHSIFLTIGLFLLYSLLLTVLIAGVAVVAFLFLLILPFMLADIASFYLAVVEFTVRRIAEYPKGPVLALSVLCGGLAALFKSFG